MKKKIIKSIIWECNSIDELATEEKLLIQKAKKAAHFAYSPYSGFSVGVALLLENSKIIQGNNQENIAYPSGLCAERVAVFYANANFPDVPIKTMALATKNKEQFVKQPIAPCGACLQVLLEAENRYKQNIKIILFGEHKINITESVKNILPLFFA